jgi:hypothetical protein
MAALRSVLCVTISVLSSVGLVFRLSLVRYDTGVIYHTIFVLSSVGLVFRLSLVRYDTGVIYHTIFVLSSVVLSLYCPLYVMTRESSTILCCDA